MSRTAPIDSYERALEYLYERVNFERVDAGSYSVAEFKLDRMRRLLELLGNPQEKIPAVHIAGTKGKGSTAGMLASILISAGYRTGLLTSPHLSAFEERFTVDGQLADHATVVRLVAAIAGHVEALEAERIYGGVSFFEITSALGWMFFVERGVEVAVLEVGLGGRLDATNVCRPEVCLITTISRDHTQQLGNELASIAAEKAGIIKPGIPVVSGVENGEARDVIEAQAARLQSPFHLLGRDFSWRGIGEHGPHGEPNRLIEVRLGDRIVSPIKVPLMGRHQAHNTTLALMGIEVLRSRGWNLPNEAVERGLERLRWPGRMEVLSKEPVVVLDSAHNWASAAALVRTLAENFQPRLRTLIFSASRDKDVRGMLRTLLPYFETVILTRAQQSARSIGTEELQRIVRGISGRAVHAVDDPQQAWRMARRWAQPDDLICIAGSIFIAAEMREFLQEEFTRGTSRESREVSELG